MRSKCHTSGFHPHRLDPRENSDLKVIMCIPLPCLPSWSPLKFCILVSAQLTYEDLGSWIVNSNTFQYGGPIIGDLDTLGMRPRRNHNLVLVRGRRGEGEEEGGGGVRKEGGGRRGGGGRGEGEIRREREREWDRGEKGKKEGCLGST